MNWEEHDGGAGHALAAGAILSRFLRTRGTQDGAFSWISLNERDGHLPPLHRRSQRPVSQRFEENGSDATLNAWRQDWQKSLEESVRCDHVVEIRDRFQDHCANPTERHRSHEM